MPKKFHVGRQHLERAFRQHMSLGQSALTTDSHLLLLLYAVETGLKRLLLQQRGLHSTERLDDDDLTHDLDQLLRTLGARERFGSCRAEPGAMTVSSDQLHEVFRYGGHLDSGRRRTVITLAQDIIDWIQESLE